MASSRTTRAVLGAATAVLLVLGTGAGCNTNGPGATGGGTGGVSGNADNGGQNSAPPPTKPSSITTTTPAP